LGWFFILVEQVESHPSAVLNVLVRERLAVKFGDTRLLARRVEGVSQGLLDESGERLAFAPGQFFGFPQQSGVNVNSGLHSANLVGRKRSAKPFFCVMHNPPKETKTMKTISISKWVAAAVNPLVGGRNMTSPLSLLTPVQFFQTGNTGILQEATELTEKMERRTRLSGFLLFPLFHLRFPRLSSFPLLPPIRFPVFLALLFATLSQAQINLPIGTLGPCGTRQSLLDNDFQSSDSSNLALLIVKAQKVLETELEGSSDVKEIGGTTAYALTHGLVPAFAGFVQPAHVSGAQRAFAETRFDAGLEVGHFDFLSLFARQNAKVGDDFPMVGHGHFASGVFLQHQVPLLAYFPNGNALHVGQYVGQSDSWQLSASL